MNGLFITIEGADGSGKTTVTHEVVKRLKETGIDVIHTREPGGIDIAEQIRDIILNPDNKEMDAKTEALLYAASRRQHLVEKVIPALNEGKLVISERYIDSSLAYQGVGRGIGLEAVYEMNRFATEDLMPHLTIFIDVKPEVGLSRINQNRTNKDRLDLEKTDFHRRVYEGYQQVKDRFKDRITVVDGNQSLEQVIEDVLQIIMKKLKE